MQNEFNHNFYNDTEPSEAPERWFAVESYEPTGDERIFMDFVRAKDVYDAEIKFIEMVPQLDLNVSISFIAPEESWIEPRIIKQFKTQQENGYITNIQAIHFISRFENLLKMVS